MRRGQQFVACTVCESGFPGTHVPAHKVRGQLCAGGPELYKGWTISNAGLDADTYHPATGRWRAVRFGVGMGHPTREGLIHMIDTKAEEERTR